MDEEIDDHTDVLDTNEATNGVDQVHEWSAFYDSDGRIYYYNGTTGESSWDAPDKYNPPPSEGASPEANEEPAEGNVSPEPSAEQKTLKSSQWAAYQDENGNTYYYNNDTGETQWDKPDNFVEEEMPGQEEAVSKEQNEGSDGEEPEPTMDNDDAEKVVQDPEGDAQEAAPEPEETVDPAVKRLADAEMALNEPDAIMEPRKYSEEGQPSCCDYYSYRSPLELSELRVYFQRNGAGRRFRWQRWWPQSHPSFDRELQWTNSNMRTTCSLAYRLESTAIN